MDLPGVVGQDHAVVIEKKLLDLRHDGKLPVVQHQGEVGAALGVDLLRFRGTTETARLAQGTPGTGDPHRLYSRVGDMMFCLSLFHART